MRSVTPKANLLAEVITPAVAAPRIPQDPLRHSKQRFYLIAFRSAPLENPPRKYQPVVSIRGPILGSRNLRHTLRPTCQR
jgi:hypothetical protein